MQNSPHKYIKNTSTNGTILIEHLLNIGERPWTPKRTRNPPPHTYTHTHTTNYTERKKKRRENGKGPVPLAGN